MSIRINPLSVAKGQAHTCELCSQPATLLCFTCRVTYYCSASHQQTDRLSIHTKICSLLGALRSLRPTLGSEDERNKRQLTITLSHHALIDLTRAEATKHLTNHNHLLAIPAALQSLRFAVQVYGKSRLELVPSYLLLAEGNLGLGRLKAAEEYLLYAHWAVVQSGERCAESQQAELHRQFGMLYVKQGKLHDAIKSYASDVYHSSLEYGPEHIETSVGIFHMGSTFLLMHQAGHVVAAAGAGQDAETAESGASQQEVSSYLDSALAFYDKYIDVWYKFLINLRSSPPASSASASAAASSSVNDYLTTPQLHTHLTHLTTILTTRSSILTPVHIATAEAAYTLAMLKESAGLDVDALWLYGRAERVYSTVLGDEHESVVGVRRAREELLGGRSGGVRLQKTARMTEWEVDDEQEQDEDDKDDERAGDGEREETAESERCGSNRSSGSSGTSAERAGDEEKEQLRIESATAEEQEEEQEQPAHESEQEQSAYESEDITTAKPSDEQQAEEGTEAEPEQSSVKGDQEQERAAEIEESAEESGALEAEEAQEANEVDNAAAEVSSGDASVVQSEVSMSAVETTTETE